MKLPRFYWYEWVMILCAATVIICLLSGCGTKREEAHHEEHQDKTTIKTTTIAETAKPTEAGALAVVESTKTTTFTEQVAKGTTDAKITATTDLQAPELAAAASLAAGIVAPGFGSVLSSAFKWFTSTPDGATFGIGAGTLLAALTKRGISGEIENRRTKRHFRAVIKGNSDFMQAHPEHAEKLKSAQRSAQADPLLKANVVEARAAQGLV